MLQQFDIIFYKGTSLISKTVEGVSKSKYSHVALVLDDFHTLESTWNTPTKIKHFEYKQGSYDVYELVTPLTDEQRKRILKFIRDNIGKGYDFKYLITRGLNLTIGTPIVNSPDRYDCDELIIDAFRSEGINLVASSKRLFPGILAESSLLKLKASY